MMFLANLVKAEMIPCRFLFSQTRCPNLLTKLEDDTCLINHNQARFAARKGIRLARAREARANAAKRRLLLAQQPKKKKVYGGGTSIDKALNRLFNERELDSTLPDPPIDNVYFVDKFKRRQYSLQECIDFHRLSAEPDLLNKPGSLLQASLELNLKMKIKKKKYIDSIESTVCYPHKFKYQLRSRKIVALSKNFESQVAAKEAGAIITGGMEIIQQLKTKQLTQRDFDHIVAHTDILLDFAAVKGMKSATFFPTKQRGNFGDDLPALVKYFKEGLDYSLKKKPEVQDYGFIQAYFGTVNMTNEQLLQNIQTLVKSINRFKPLNLEDGKQFFHRLIITSEACDEIMVCKFWEFCDDYVDPSKYGLDEDDEQDENEEKSNTSSARRASS